jgi:hypothetical protein
MCTEQVRNVIFDVVKNLMINKMNFDVKSVVDAVTTMTYVTEPSHRDVYYTIFPLFANGHMPDYIIRPKRIRPNCRCEIRAADAPVVCSWCDGWTGPELVFGVPNDNWTIEYRYVGDPGPGYELERGVVGGAYSTPIGRDVDARSNLRLAGAKRAAVRAIFGV